MSTIHLQHLLALLTVLAANLPVANAITFTNATTISEANATYDGQDVIVDGTTVTIDGTHSFNSLLLTNGAVLTHSACTTLATHKLELIVTNTVLITSNSKIDVTSKGYAPGRTTGNTTVGAAQGSSSASYGGNGVGANGAPNRVYGNHADPNNWGAGAGLPGGGLLRLQAGNVNLQGQILANGGSGIGASCGAGGSIRIDTETLNISGIIQVRGGTGNLGGGGGRVAVYAHDYFGLTRNSIVALGGDGPARGGAGTIYVRDTDEAYGTLTIDNGTGLGNATPLGVPGTNSLSIPDLVVVRGSGTLVRPEHGGLVVEFQRQLWVDEAAQLVNDGDALQFLVSPVITGGASWTVNGAMTLNLPLTLLSNATMTVSGVLTSSVPQIISGCTLSLDRIVAPALVLPISCCATR